MPTSPATSPQTGDVRSVLFVTHALHLGGVSTYMSTLGRGLMARGVRVAIATRLLNEGKQHGREYFESIGMPIFQCGFPGYSPNLTAMKQAWVSSRQLKQAIQQTAADVVHVQAPTLCLGVRMTGAPYVTTFNIAVNGKNKIRMARLVNKLSGRAFGSTSIAISTELAEGLVRDLHIPASRVKRLIYTIDDRQFSPATPEQKMAARTKFGLQQQGLVVCMVASLEERKNHTLMLDAMEVLVKRGRPIPLLLAGSGWGDLAERLRDNIRHRGLESHVHYVGQQAAQAVYHASDIFVLPSTQEGFPLSTVEAMLSGIVPIRTPSEGARDQIKDGETGFIVPFAPPDVLADRLQELAEDESKRLRLASAARAFAVEYFRADVMVEQTLAVYRSAVEESKAGGRR